MDEEVCCGCGTTKNVKTYLALPAFLGWYSIPAPKNYCNDCISAEKHKAVDELTKSFAGSPNVDKTVEKRKLGLNAPGTIAPVFEEPMYYSNRGIPLITQYLTGYWVDGKPRAHLTVENYEKWYSLFVIHVDGTVEQLTFGDLEEPEYSVPARDHAINPDAFHLTAVKRGLEYDNRTFALVCERWVEDVLDDDWKSLVQYLPKYE